MMGFCHGGNMLAGHDDDDDEDDDGANCLYLNIQIRSNATESFAPMSLR